MNTSRRDVLKVGGLQDRRRERLIKSIIPPPLASHVRREAVRFIDELKRTQAG